MKEKRKKESINIIKRNNSEIRTTRERVYSLKPIIMFFPRFGMDIMMIRYRYHDDPVLEDQLDLFGCGEYGNIVGVHSHNI
jgi:hypothetical protein